MSIAYCIPVYKHNEQLQESIIGCIDYLANYNIDIYVFDSSPDDVNRNFVASLQEQGYDSLYYISIDEDVIAADKVMMIYKQEYMQKKYDFIWLVKDRSYWSEDLIYRVVNACEKNPDAIVLHTIDNPNNSGIEYKEIYNQITELYRDWAWLITSWESLIINSEITNRVKFDELRKKYYIDNDTNFPPVITLFTALSQNEYCNVAILNAENSVHNFNAPMDETGREEALFKVWGYNWYHTNMLLPDIYNEYKEYVIKSTASLPWLIGNRMRLIELYYKGILNIDRINIVRDIWRYLSDIPWEELECIVSGDIEYIENCFVNSTFELIKTNSMNYALYYYSKRQWYVEGVSNYDVQITSYIMDIYFLEMQKLGYANLFSGGNSREYLFDLIENSIRILKIIDDEEMVKDTKLRDYIKSDKISKYMVLYLASRECKDAERVLKTYMSM